MAEEIDIEHTSVSVVIAFAVVEDALEVPVGCSSEGVLLQGLRLKTP
jgi:hypothetical protein